MNQSRIDGEVQAIERWYLDRVRPFLERIEAFGVKASRIDDFDKELERLKDARSAYKGDLVVCFLGIAGIGKSTLINALVDGRRSVLPHGGIGPLTAQALSVRRGSPTGFTVEYQPPRQLWKLTNALMLGFRDQLSRPSNEEAEAGRFEDSLLGEDEQADLGDLPQDEEPDERSPLQSYRKQAQLLVRGDQNSQVDLFYLIDALRIALGKPAKWGTELSEEDAGRVRRIGDALASGRYECPASAADGRFREELRIHATGYLAPLIKDISVTYESETLPEGVVLVDLPGLGVAGDIHKEVTTRWVREQARSVVLVVGHRGIQDAEAQLLQQSGFLNRLIYSAENPADDPVSLMVAVVRVDEIAGTRYREARESGDAGKRRQDLFADACEESRRLVVDQLKPQLEKAWASGEIQSAQAQVIENVLATLDVHPISAVEYAKCLLDDPDDRSFLSQPDLSNIPGFLDALKRQAGARRQAEDRRLEEVRGDFQSRLDAALNVIRAQWMEDTRATEEAARLREEFLVFIEPLRGEYQNRQGAYREFLRETLPQTIRTEVVKASSTARRELKAYLAELRIAHYKTLQAAVLKGGTFIHGIGRKIDLANDFALRFEVPVADAWAKCVLKEIRRRTKEFADDCIRLVDDVVAWAKAQGTRVQPRLVEALRDEIKADAKVLDTVGRAAVDQLRDEVKTQLVKKIEGPIRKRCKTFVDKDEHRGTGTRGRILELFDKLAEEVTETASGPAEQILLTTFQAVEQEILEVFGKHPNPLDAARDTIVEAHEKQVRRSDAQRRRQVLADVEAVIADRPVAPSGEGETQAA